MNNKTLKKAGGEVKTEDKVMKSFKKYFSEYWGKNIFMKSVSLLVAVCFLVNIANLPAYAQDVNDELLKKRIETKRNQDAVTAPQAVKPVNEQVGVNVNAISDLSSGEKRELDRREMAITGVGIIKEKGRNGKEQMVGSLDEKGKINIHSGDSSRPFSKEREEDYKFRAQQVLESGAGRDKYVSTHSREYLNSVRGEREGEKPEAGLTAAKREEKKAQAGEIEGDAKKKEDAVKTVQGKEEKQLAARQEINESGAEEKQKAIMSRIKDKKDTASVTKATIGQVQESGKKAGINLIAGRNVAEGKEKIELYSSRYTGENVFVGKAGGQMAYPTHNGSVEVREAKKTLNIGGNEFEATGVSLVRGEARDQDNTVNKNAEGLFFTELLTIFGEEQNDERVSGELRKRLDESDKQERGGILNTVSEYAPVIGKAVKNASGVLEKTLDGASKGVLAAQSLLVETAVKSVQESGKTKKASDDESKNEDYDEVADELAKQSGLSREEVDKALAGIEKSKLDNAIGLLKEFFAQGGQIINCATDAISNILGGTIGKGLIALQTLAADIAGGTFGKESIKDGQIYTSMSAMNKVLKANGKDSAGYGISLEDFKEGLKEGESGILWVDGNHYVTVTKEKDNRFSVSDPNKNNGQKITYSSEEFDNLMNGKEAKDVDGVTRQGYQVDVNDMKVLTDSKGIEQKADEGKAKVLSVEETNEIMGAKYVTRSVTRTRTETRTGVREEERTGTRSYVDENGESHSEQYTYTVQVEYTYEVEVEYTEEETVWVDDPEDKESEEEKEAIRKAEEEKEIARQEAQRAREAEERARVEAEVAQRNLEREIEAREAAVLGENTKKDENGEETKREISAEEAEADSAAFEEKIEGMEEEVVNKTIEAQVRAQEYEEKSGVAEEAYKNNLEKIEGTQNRDEKALETAQKEYKAAQVESGQAQKNLEQATNKFVNLSGNGEEFRGVKQEEVNKALKYLNNVISNGGSVINCAAEALSNVIGGASKAVLALQAISIDIGSGAFFKNNDINNQGASQVMVSMFAMSKILKDGQEYKGYLVGGVEAVNEGLENGSVILNVNIKDKDGKDTGHYISLHTQENGDVTIKDANKEDKVITKAEIDNAKLEGKDAVGDYLKETYNWQGGAMLAAGEIKSGKAMSESAMQETAGAGLWSGIKRAVKKVVNTVRRAVSGGSRSSYSSGRSSGGYRSGGGYSGGRSSYSAPRYSPRAAYTPRRSYTPSHNVSKPRGFLGGLFNAASSIFGRSGRNAYTPSHNVSKPRGLFGGLLGAAAGIFGNWKNNGANRANAVSPVFNKLFGKGLFNSPTGKAMTGKTALGGVLGVLKAITKSPQVQNAMAQVQLSAAQKRATDAAASGTAEEQSAANEALKQAEEKARSASEALAAKYESQGQQEKADNLRMLVANNIKGGQLAVTAAGAGLEVSYDREEGFTVSGENLESPVAVSDIGDGSVESFKRFADTYKEGSEAISGSGLKLQYNKEKDGFGITGERIEGEIDLEGTNAQELAKAYKASEGTDLKFSRNEQTGAVEVSGSALESPINISGKNMEEMVETYKELGDSGLKLGYDEEKGYTISVPGSEKKVSVKDIKDGDIKSFVEDYKRVSASQNFGESGLGLSFDEQRGIFVISGTHLESPVAVSDIDGDIDEFARQYGKFASVMGEDSGLTMSYDPEKGLLVKGDNLSVPVNAEDVEDASVFVEQYKSASEAIGDSGLSLSYDKEKGLMIGGGELSSPVAVGDIADGDIKSFVSDYKAAVAAEALEGSGLKLEFDAGSGRLVLSGDDLENPVAVRDIKNINDFAKQYKAVSADITEDSGLKVAYDAEKGLMVTGEALSEPVAVSEVDDIKGFVKQYKEAAGELGESGLKLTYERGRGLLLSGENLESPIAVSDVKNIKQFVSDYEAIEGSGLKLGYDGEKKEIVVSGENLESPISVSDIEDMKKFAGDYKAIEGSGLKLGYDGEKKEIVVSGENFETPIAVSDIENMEKFAKDYKTASNVIDGVEGAGASYNKETQEWEVTLPNISKKINASDIDNTEKFVQQYKTVMDAYNGIEGSSCAYDTESKEWTIKVPGVEDAIKASAISDGKTFADEYNAAKAVTGGVEGIEGVEDKDVTFGYNSETQKWEVKVPGYDKTINVSDIGTSEENIKTFIDDYKILKDIKDNYESGAKFEYDAENGWTVSLPDIAESKDPSQALEQLKDIKEKQDALDDSKEILDEKQENFTNGEEAWNQAIEDYINGKITEEQYLAAKEKRDKERAELQTAINDVDSKTDALEESQTNAGYSQEHRTASVSGYREASKNAKSVMETADESANNTAAEALKNAAGSYAGVFEEPGEGEEPKTPEEMQAAQDKYLRALTAVNDTTAAVNATYTNNNSEEEAKKKQEAQSKKTGDTVNEAQTKVTDAMEEAMIGAHDTLSGSDISDAAAQQARNILDFISKAGKPLYDALTDLSVNLYGDISKTISGLADRTSLASQGITVSNGVVTQRTFDKNGNPVTRELQLQNSQSDTDIMSVMSKDGFDAGMNYIKSHGLYKKETLYNYDAEGNKKEIYTAKSIGISGDAENGNASVGIEYTFSQAYSDELYLVNIQGGQSKIITESFNEGEPEFAMVYDATPSSDSNAQTNEYKTDSGLTIKTTSELGSVERVTQWGETKQEDGVTRRTAKTVTFKDGLPSTFESATVTFDASNGSKTVTADVTLLDGAVTYPEEYDKPTGEGGSDEEQRTIVDEYADLLKAAEGLKINGQDYDVFNAVSNDHIDLSKVVTGAQRSITFEGGVQSSANSSTLAATDSSDDGKVGANLPLYAGEGQSVPNDWRNHYKDSLQESINSGTQGTVSAYDDKGRIVTQAKATFTNPNDLIGSYTLGNGEEDIKFYKYETSADGKTETVSETTKILNPDDFDSKNILTINGDFSNCNKVATTTNADGSKTVVSSAIEGGETQSERTLYYGRYGNITGGSGWDRQTYKKNEDGSGIVGTSTIEYTYDMTSGEFKVSGETFDPGAKFYMNAEDKDGLAISSSGNVTFNGQTYDITNVKSREDLFNAAMEIKADEAAYEAMSSMCTDGQKVVKDSDGNYMIVEDKIFAEGEEGILTNSGDNVEVFDRNGDFLGFVDDGSIKRTSVIENDKVKITYDTRNWAGQGDVKVEEITLLSDGSRVTVSMNHNTQFFGDDTTNTTVTKTNADGSEEVIANESGNLGFFGGGKGNDLKSYGNGTYKNGTIDLGNGTTVTVSDANFTSPDDNIFGLSGKYQRSSVSVAGVNGDDRQVLTTDSIRNANGNIVANAVYNTTLDKSSLPEDDPNTAYDERLKSFDPMNRQNATVDVQVTNYDLKTGEITSSSYEGGRAYADENNVIQAGYDWQSSNTDAPAFTFKTPAYIQSVKNELSELGYGDVQIMPGFELPGEFNGKPMNDYFVFYEDNGWWGINDSVTLVDRTTGEKFTASSTWGDGDPVIRANPDGSGDAVTIKKTDTGVQLNFSQQTMVREAYTTTTAQGGSIYHPAQYRTDKEGEIISVSNNEDGSWSQYSYRDITNKRIEMKTTEFSSNGTRTVERTLEGDWSGNIDELGRPPELTNISGKEIIYTSTGKEYLSTTISGDMRDIKYGKSSIDEFKPANYTEITTNYTTGETTKVEYDGGIIKYKEVNGQRIVVGAINVDRTTSVWVGGKDNGYFQVITKEHINELSKTVSSADDTDSSGNSTGTKTVTETTTASDIDTTYYVDGKPVYTANTKLLTGTGMPLQTTKTVYDKINDNRVISETQTGGIFETKLMRIEPGMTDKMPKDIQTVIDENGGIPEGGLVIDKKKNDKTTTYEYGKNGLVTAVNTDEKQYDYMAGTVTDTRSSSRTENGITDTASETYVYRLTQADSDAKRAADKNNVISHTANYSSEIIVPSDIKEQGSEAVKEYLEKRGMDLTGLTDEQRENLSSMDKFILSDTSVNFNSGEISVIQNAIVKNSYNPDGTLAKSKAAGTKTTAKADPKQLLQFFKTPDESSGESSGFSSLYSSAKDLNGAILSDINYPSKATLLSDISTSEYNTVTENKYDVLKRLSSADEHNITVIKNAAGELVTVETTAHTDVIYDSSAKNGVLKTTQGQNAHSDTVVKNAAGKVIYTEVTDAKVDAKTQNAESVSVKTDADGNLISTTTSTTVVADGQATTTTVTRDAGGAITEQSTSTEKAGSNYYSYGNLSNSNITINIGAVTTFNESGFARDAQIEARDYVKNTIIAAAVTVAFVVLSIATLGIGTAIAAGASAAIIAAKLAMLAFSAVMVYQGTKAAMNALSVGDYESAALNAAFVALNFVPVIGKLASKAITAAQSAMKIGQGMQKFLKIVNGILNPVSSPNIASALKITNQALGKVIDLGFAIGRNYVIYKELVPRLLRASGYGGITENELFKTFTTFLVFAPIFNKKFARASGGAQEASGGKLFAKETRSWGELFRQGKEAFKMRMFSADGINIAVSRGGRILNFLANGVVQSAGMIADIIKFNTYFINGGLGGLNTVIYNITDGKTLGDIPLLGDLIFKNVPVFTDYADFMKQSLTSATGMMTTPSMWAFSYLTAAALPILSPVLQKTPILGRVIGAFDKISGRLNNKFLETFLEENVKEELLGKMWGWVPNESVRQILQECFDSTPDGNFNTYQQLNNAINSTATQRLTAQDSTRTQRLEAAQQLADISGLTGVHNTRAVNDITSIIDSAGGISVKSAHDIIRNQYQVQTGTPLSKREVKRRDLSHVQILQSQNSTNEQKQKAAEEIAYGMGFTDSSADSFVSDIMTGIESNSSVPALVASTYAAQSYQDRTGTALTNEQLRRIQNIAQSREEFARRDVAATAMLMSQAVVPLVTLLNDNIAGKIYTSNGKLDFSKATSEEMSLAFKDMTNRQLSDFMKAVIFESDVTMAGGVRAVLDAATAEFAKSGEYTQQIKSDIAAIVNQKGKDIESIEQELAEYRNTEKGTLREQGARETLVNEAIERLTNESLLTQSNTKAENTRSAVLSVFEGGTNIDALISIGMTQADVLSMANIIKSGSNIKLENIVSSESLEAVGAGVSGMTLEQLLSSGAEFEVVGKGKSAEVNIKITVNGQEYTLKLNKALAFFVRNPLGDVAVNQATGKKETPSQTIARNLEHTIDFLNVKYNNLKDTGSKNETEVLNDLTANLIGSQVFMDAYVNRLGYSDYRIGQKNAIFEIYAQVLNGSSAEESFRYINKLRTGGGKTVITALTTALLSARAADGKIITVLTNTSTNASALLDDMKPILGMNDTELVKPDFSNKAKAKEALEGAKVIVTDYNSYNGVVANDWSVILNDANIGQEVRDFLSKKDIQISESESGKLEFADAFQSNKALELLLDNQKLMEKINQLEGVTMQLDRIGDAVCDEIDSFTTNPQQALAEAQGLYLTSQSAQDYCDRMQKLLNERKSMSSQEYEEALLSLKSDFSDMSEIIESDLKALGRMKNTETRDAYFEVRKNLYSQIGDMLATGASNQSIIDSLGNAAISQSNLNIKQVNDTINAFRESNITVDYWTHVYEASKGISEISDANSTTTKIKDSVATNEAASEFEKKLNEYASTKQDTGRLQQDTSGLSAADRQKKAMEESERVAKEIYAQYGKKAGFTYQQVLEHVRNAASASKLTENGNYKVLDGKICVIHNGQDSPSMTMPAGQMQALEIEKGLALSRPSKDSYVSNSVFAMGLFSNIVGVTGTVSKTAKVAVLDKMGFVVDGTAIDVKTLSAIVATSIDRADLIYDITRNIQKGGQAAFNLVLTADSNDSRGIYTQLLSRMINDSTLEDSVKTKLLENLDAIVNNATSILNDQETFDKVKELTDEANGEGKFKGNKCSNERRIGIANEIIDIKSEKLLEIIAEKAGLTEAEKSLVKNNDIVGKIAEVGFVDSGVSSEGVDLLKYELRSGAYSYIISDAILIGRGWDASDMNDTKDVFNARQGKKQGQKVAVNNWLIDTTLMTATVLEQGAGRTDQNADGRFDRKSYDKNLISLHSVERLRENETLSKVADAQGGWSLDLIENNLEKVWTENEEKALQGAGIKITPSATQKGITNRVDQVSDDIRGLKVVDNFEKIADFINGSNIENEDFTKNDIINSFGVLAVSEWVLRDKCKMDLSKAEFVRFELSGEKDTITFIVDYEGTETAIDMIKNKGIVEVRNNADGEIIWKTEGSAVIIERKDSEQGPVEKQPSIGITMETMGGEIEEVSIYGHIKKLGNEKLQNLVADPNQDITERFLALFELKKKGVDVEVSDEMLASAKQHLIDINNGNVKVITDEEESKQLYLNASDRLKASLGMVYAIMLESHVERFDLDETEINGIWNKIYDKAKVVPMYSGRANSELVFQPEALLPDVMAHELMHNITDVYLGTDKSLTSASLAEFTSDVIVFTLFEQLGLPIPQRWQNTYKEKSSYIKTGALNMEEHALGRGFIGLCMEMAVKAGTSVNWDNMLTAVAQNLQNSNFIGFVQNDRFMLAHSKIMDTYFEIELGRPIKPHGNLMEETTSNLYDMIEYYFNEYAAKSSKSKQKPQIQEQQRDVMEQTMEEEKVRRIAEPAAEPWPVAASPVEPGQAQQPVQPAQQTEAVSSVQVQQSAQPIQQPELPVINITTPLSVINEYGMPAVVEKVQSIVGNRAAVGEREIEAALKNCAVDALTAMGRVTEINALSSLLADVILTQALPEVGLDYELAAGFGEEAKQIMLKDVRKNGRGLEYALTQDLEKLQLPAEGVIGVLNKADEANLHLVNIRGVEDGIVSYVESGELKEAALDEFKAMGFEGLIMTDRKTKRVNKGLLSSLNASDEQIRNLLGIEASDKEKFASSGEYKGARKLADMIINGVTEGEELNKAVLYTLNIWKNTAEMAGALGIEESDIDSENGAEKVTQGYYVKVSEVLRAGEEGVLSPGEVMAEVKLLSTVRDMLITINRDKSGKMKELLNKESLEMSDISDIMSLLTVSKAVNHNVLIRGLEAAKISVESEGEEIINIDKLKRSVEEKKSVRERFKGKFFGNKAKLEEILPALGSDTFVNVRGTMHSPLMARALAAAA